MVHLRTEAIWMRRKSCCVRFWLTWARKPRCRCAPSWRRSWAGVYGFLADQLESSNGLRQAAVVVRYEDLCTEPLFTLRTISAHCGLADDESIGRFASRIHAPTYYDPDFSDRDIDTILSETSPVAHRFGYDQTLSGTQLGPTEAKAVGEPVGS